MLPVYQAFYLTGVFSFMIMGDPNWFCANMWHWQQWFRRWHRFMHISPAREHGHEPMARHQPLAGIRSLTLPGSHSHRRLSHLFAWVTSPPSGQVHYLVMHWDHQ